MENDTSLDSPTEMKISIIFYLFDCDGFPHGPEVTLQLVLQQVELAGGHSLGSPVYQPQHDLVELRHELCRY